MTNEQAIKILGTGVFKTYELAAVIMAIEALEKQIPKKIICETVDKTSLRFEFEHYKCPNCKIIIHQHYRKSKEPMKYKQNYCYDCGQSLDWSDNND